MLKLTKKADYGLIAVKHLAERGHGNCLTPSASAKDIADRFHIPQEAMAKILQRLVKAGLLVSQHGTNGGYTLARSARLISALEVIKAIDGPLFITSCSGAKGDCMQESSCNVREPLRKVNDSIRELLGSIKISDMTDEMEPPAVPHLSFQRDSASHEHELVTLAK